MSENETAAKTHRERVAFNPVNNERLNHLCGPCNTHLHELEKYFNVVIDHQSNHFQLRGQHKNTLAAKQALIELYETTSYDSGLTTEKIRDILHHYNIKMSDNNHSSFPTGKSPHAFHGQRKIVQARTPNQNHYMENLLKYPINFGIGPAGTGKTYLAVACAVSALTQGRVQRLIVVRPAVEAGEKLGFLPGDLTEKVLPYLRPIYDALHDILGFEETQKMIGRNIIEVAPLAFMRGRTLNDAFIILDEAQNTTLSQMKMFLTRIGFGSIAVITGDITQIDLPKGIASGLTHAIDIVKNIEGIHLNFFTSADVVRNPLVSKIIHAYEAQENKA